jgi:hypothetical protein
MLQVNFWCLTILILFFDDLVSDLKIRMSTEVEPFHRKDIAMSLCFNFQAFMEFAQEVAVFFAAHIQ